MVARDGVFVVEAIDPTAAQRLVDGLLAALNDPGVSTYRGHPVRVTCPALERFERSFP